jgi:hypothetical protein
MYAAIDVLMKNYANSNLSCARRVWMIRKLLDQKIASVSVSPARFVRAAP